MASLAQQPQQANQIPPDISPNVAGVVEVFADQEIKQLLSPFVAGVQISSEQTLTPRLKEGITNMVYGGDLSAGRSALSMQRGSLAALCQYGLPEDYIASDLFDHAWDEDDDTWRRSLSYEVVEEDNVTSAPTNLILILYDTDQYSQRKIPRGIALCSVNATRMKLLVLGATRPSMTTRSNRHYARGGQLLRAVQYLGAKRTYIELYALETVITLYHKFGWRFIDPANCGQGKPGGAAERGHYREAVKALFKLYRDAGEGEPNEEILTKVLTAFRGFAMGRAGMWRQGKRGAEATEAGRDNGYKMILCQQNNPYTEFLQSISSQQQQAQGASKSGGRRRRRKRTKKKALKKKHRRTRRKKKRKTRRRRKRRGGKKKLSRKHCHSLKQKHTKMAHQLHRAGQAIRVQCGMRGGGKPMPTKVSCSIFGEADSCKNVAYKYQKGGDKSCVGAKDGISGCRTCCGTDSGSCIDHCMK